MRKNRILGQDNSKTTSSRAKFNCPDPLTRAINMANLISDLGGLPDINFFIECIKEAYPSGTFENFNEIERYEATAQGIVYALLEDFDWFIIDLVKQAYQIAGKRPDLIKDIALFPPDVSRFIVNIYAGTKTDIDNFINFVEMLGEVRAGTREKNNLGTFPLRARTFIDENNKVIVESMSPLFDAIENIDADRLRICEICEHIFWAKNKNSQGCTKNCVSALYQRNLRKRDKENINRQRRKKYYEKNSIPFHEECMSPVTKCSCYEKERRQK